MENQEEQIKPGEADFRFLTLVMSLASAAWAQLGKVPHPATQKIEKDLEQAQMTIEFLRMLREKTQGNLKPKENELLSGVVSDLELNFADEMAKEKPAGAEKKGPDIIIPAGGLHTSGDRAPSSRPGDMNQSPGAGRVEPASKGPEIIKP